jgi:hypothetical protein
MTGQDTAFRTEQIDRTIRNLKVRTGQQGQNNGRRKYSRDMTTVAGQL